MACPIRDDLVAYSLGALEADEERSVEAHLPGCERCIRELRSLAPAVAVLAESVEQVEPPPELRERLLTIVSEEAERPVLEPTAPARVRPGLARFILRPATGLAALAFVGAGVTGYLIRDEEGDGGTDTVPISTGGIAGSLQVSDDSAMLEVRGMPQLAKGSVYQVWVDEAGMIRPTSSFVPDPGGSATAAVREHLDSGDRVMVTSEPGPGRVRPSGPPLLSARID